jgi:hypothetical protein
MSTWQTKQNQRAAGAEVQITGEAYVIGADAANFVFLNEVPRLNDPSSVSVLQGAIPFTEVAGTPGVGQFRVYYDGRLLGALEFNAADNGKSISVGYWGRGSNVFARDLNRLQTEKLDADGTQALTGPLRVPNGTAVAPTLTFTSDAALGFFRSAANTLGITVSGTQIGSIASSGINLSSGSFSVGGVAVSLSTHSHALSALTGLLDLAQINASGTRDANTYLRGDGTWAIIPTGGSGITQVFADGRYLQLTGGTLTGALVVSGQSVTADRYLTGSARLSIRATTTDQAAIIAWNGLQLIGARQATVDYAPATEGGNLVAAGVIIPNQTASAIALYIRAATSQSAALTLWVNNAGTTLASLSSSGVMAAADFTVSGVSVSLSTHSHALSSLSGSLNISQINASGTRDGTTFLRGDGTWAPIGGGGGGGLTFTDTDARYLQLTGGVISGSLNVLTALTVSGVAVSLVGHVQGAESITTGTLSDARLSANVALLNTVQTHTAPRTHAMASTTSEASLYRVASDTVARLAIRADGQLSWGPGATTAADVTVARTGAAALTLTGSLNVTSSLTVNGTAVTVVGHTHSAGDLTTGTLADGRLSTNVRLLNVAQTTVASETFVLTNTTDFAISVRTSSDTQFRFRQRADGQMSWGPGGSTATDVTLSRSASATMTMSGSMVITGGLTVGGANVSVAGHTHSASEITSGTFVDGRLSPNVLLGDAAQTVSGAKTFAMGTATTTALAVRVSTDSETRLLLRADGQMSWGSGAAAPDVSVSRSGASTLALNGNFTISGSLTVGGNAIAVVGHVHSAADITTGTLADGRLSANVMLLDTARNSTVVITVTRTATTDAAYVARLSSDTQARYQIRTDGQLSWGPGSTMAPDVFLSRSGGATLTVTGSLNVTSTLSQNGTAVALTGHTHSASDITTGTLPDSQLSSNVALLGTAQTYTTLRTITRATTADGAVAVRITSDTQPRLQILASGALNFGAGASSATDVTLSRTAAATLTVTGALNVTSTLTQNGTAVSLAGHGHSFTEITGSLALSQINATGTRDSSTYLRGDGTWATVSGGGGISQAFADARYLQLTGGTLATVAITGNLSSIQNIAYTWPSSQGAANTVLVNNGSGTLSWGAVPSHTHAATDLTGTLADARLSTNVMLLGSSQTVTGTKTFESGSLVTLVQTRYTGEAHYRIAITTAGQIQFGSGANATAEAMISRPSNGNLRLFASSTLQLIGTTILIGEASNTAIQVNGAVQPAYWSSTGVSGSYSPTLTAGNHHSVSLSGSTTISLPSGVTGGTYVLDVVPNGNSWSLNTSNIRFAAGGTQPIWSTSGRTVLVFYYTGFLHHCAPFGQNFATS